MFESDWLTNVLRPSIKHGRRRPVWMYCYQFKRFRFKQQDLRQDNRMLIGSRLHSSQIETCLFLVRCVFEWCEHARAFTSSLSERIRKIIWIIFSAINNINFAPHLTQTCCILPVKCWRRRSVWIFISQLCCGFGVFIVLLSVTECQRKCSLWPMANQVNIGWHVKVKRFQILFI